MLHGSGSLRSRRRSALGGVEERVLYPVPVEQLRRIAAAGSVRVRVLGTREYVERRFSPKSLLRLREFIRTRVDSLSTSPAAPGPAGQREPLKRRA